MQSTCTKLDFLNVSFGIQEAMGLDRFVKSSLVAMRWMTRASRTRCGLNHAFWGKTVKDILKFQ